MEFAFPIGIIIYIILAVISAVLRSYTQQQGRPPQRTAQPLPPQTPEGNSSVVEPLQPTGMGRRGSQLEVSSELESSASAQEQSMHFTKSKRSLALTRQELREAVIMTELLREPRAKRPWPNR